MYVVIHVPKLMNAEQNYHKVIQKSIKVNEIKSNLINKIPKLISLQNCVRATESHIQNSKNLFFSEKLIERTDEKTISSFLQLF